jgi:hypothetical protein
MRNSGIQKTVEIRILRIRFLKHSESNFSVHNLKLGARSAQNRLATIRLPYAGPTTGLKSAKCRLYERRLLADFRPVVGPAYGSRMVANQIRADRVVIA